MGYVQRYVLATACLWFGSYELATAAEWGASVTQGVEYDNNAHGVENDTTPEIALNTGFSTELDHDSAHWEVELGYDLDYTTYRKRQFDDNHSVDGSGKVTWIVLPERFTWFVSDEQGYSVVNPQESDTPENRAQKQSRATGPVLTIPLSPVDTAELEAEYTVSSVDADTKSESEIKSASLTWEHLLSPTKDMELTLSKSKTEFGESDNGFEASSVSLGINTVQASGALDVSVGIDRLETDEGAERDSTSYDVVFTRQFSNTEIGLSGTRMLTDSVSTGGNADTDRNYDNEEALVRTVYALDVESGFLGARTDITTGVSWQLDDFKTAETKQLSKNVELELTHELTWEISISGVYNYQWIQFTEEGKTVDIEQTFLLSLDYQVSEDLEVGMSGEASIRRFGRDEVAGTSSFDIRKNVIEITATYTLR